MFASLRFSTTAGFFSQLTQDMKALNDYLEHSCAGITEQVCFIGLS